MWEPVTNWLLIKDTFPKSTVHGPPASESPGGVCHNFQLGGVLVLDLRASLTWVCVALLLTVTKEGRLRETASYSCTVGNLWPLWQGLRIEVFHKDFSMLWSTRWTHHFLSQTISIADYVVLPNNKGARKCGRTLVHSYYIFGTFKFLVEFHTAGHEQSRCGLL